MKLFCLLLLVIFFSHSIAVEDHLVSHLRVQINGPKNGMNHLQLVEYIKNKKDKTIMYIDDKLTSWWPRESFSQAAGFMNDHNHCIDVILATFYVYKPEHILIELSRDMNTYPALFYKETLESGKLIFISAFGDYFSVKGDPKEKGKELAEWVNEYKYLDGVDFNFEDSIAIETNFGIQWIIDFHKSFYANVNDKSLIITHAPVAPYFSKKHYSHFPGAGGLSYLDVEKEVTVDWYNIQYYNQQDCRFDTYESIFEQSSFNNCWVSDVSVRELMKVGGIPPEKIIIGKPRDKIKANNTGFIPPSILGKFAKKAEKNGIKFGGFMVWSIESSNHCRYFKELFSEYKKEMVHPDGIYESKKNKSYQSC